MFVNSQLPYCSLFKKTDEPSILRFIAHHWSIYWSITAHCIPVSVGVLPFETKGIPQPLRSVFSGHLAPIKKIFASCCCIDSPVLWKDHLSSSETLFFFGPSIDQRKDRRNPMLLFPGPHDVTLLLPVHVLFVSSSHGCSFVAIGSERHPGISSDSIWRCYHQHVPIHQSAPLRDPGDHHQWHPQTFPRGKRYT